MIVLHIGMPKTGTSALQHSLMQRSREKVPGLLYPAIGRDGAVAHHALARTIDKRGADIAEVHALVEMGTEATVPMVLSSEAFNNVHPRTILDLVTRLEAAGEVRVLLVVREMASFLESMYLQSTRTGRTTMTFDHYVTLRTRNWFGAKCWLRERFRHMRALKDCLGDRLYLRFVTPGFNTLNEFERLVELPATLLTRYESGLPKNIKGSLKAQIAVLYLPEIEKRIGLPLDRRRLTRAMRNEFSFADDVVDYTLLSERRYRSIGREARKWAARYGVQEYVDAFPAPGSDRGKPFARLDLRRLTSEDLELIAHYGLNPGKSNSKALTSGEAR